MGSKWLRQAHTYTVSTPRHPTQAKTTPSRFHKTFSCISQLESIELGHTLRMGVLNSAVFLTCPNKPPSSKNNLVSC